MLEKNGFHLLVAVETGLMEVATFIDLSEDDLEDLAPVVGDRVDIQKLLAKVR